MATTVDSGNETLLSDDSPPCDMRGSIHSPGGPASLQEGYHHQGGFGAPRDRAGFNGQHHTHRFPPKIQPYSGVLGQGKVVIRPIAFRPVGSASCSSSGRSNGSGLSGGSSGGRFSNAGERYSSTPILASRPGSQINTYGSSNDLRHVHNNYSLDRKLMSCASISPPLAMASLTSLPLSSERKFMDYDSLESVRKSPSLLNSQVPNTKSTFRLRCGASTGSVLDLTPSPSDSGISELEAALRERDSELTYLRQTMEHNEQVIFRVYQEKERVWEREIRRIKSLHDNRLRASAQKALKLEQMLMMQSYQLQQEKKKMAAEAEDFREEVGMLRGRLEDTEWNLCQKSGEIALLKTQLKELQNDTTMKDHEILQLRGEYRDVIELSNIREKQVITLKNLNEERAAETRRLENELTQTNNTNLDINKMSEIEALKAEVKELREELLEVGMSEYEGIECGRSLRGIWLQGGKFKNIQSENGDDSLNGIYDTCKNDVKWKIADEEKFSIVESEVIITTDHEKCTESDKLIKEMESNRAEFEKERKKWAEEKEKVLKYQKQLQLNYVQMFRKTRSLETEVESLRLELQIAKKSPTCFPNQKSGQTIEL